MYRCPTCGSTNLEVTVQTWATLIQTAEGFQTDTATPDDASHEWGANSVMRCTDCDAQEIAERFEAKKEDASRAGG
jgi:RNA polymerase subunit RPABC4/transcription elongation factor Spt4